MKSEDLDIIKTKILKNSKSLIDESKILFKKGFYARTFTLSHLAVEELIKIPMVVSAISNLKPGKELNYKTFLKNYSNHKFKILSSILFFIVNLADNDELDNLDIKKMDEETVLLNTLKNSSLYVHIEKDKYTAPYEIINKNIAEVSFKRASFLYDFFIYAERKKGNISPSDIDYINIEKLSSVKKDPVAISDAIKLLNKKFVELKRKKVIIN